MLRLSLYGHYVFHFSSLAESKWIAFILKQGLQCGPPSTFDGTSSQGHQLLAMGLMSSEAMENIFSVISFIFLKHANVECNVSGKGPVSYGHDPRWTIPECCWETFAYNDRSNESAKEKGPCPRSFNWDGARGQWSNWGQELKGDNGDAGILLQVRVLFYAACECHWVPLRVQRKLLLPLANCNQHLLASKKIFTSLSNYICFYFMHPVWHVLQYLVLFMQISLCWSDFQSAGIY